MRLLFAPVLALALAACGTAADVDAVVDGGTADAAQLDCTQKFPNVEVPRVSGVCPDLAIPNPCDDAYCLCDNFDAGVPVRVNGNGGCWPGPQP